MQFQPGRPLCGFPGFIVVIGKSSTVIGKSSHREVIGKSSGSYWEAIGKSSGMGSEKTGRKRKKQEKGKKRERKKPLFQKELHTIIRIYRHNG